MSEPIRAKYVKIFSLQQNISEMSVKTIWEKLMRKDFFTPPWQEEGQKEGREKSKEEDWKQWGGVGGGLLWADGEREE